MSNATMEEYKVRQTIHATTFAADTNTTMRVRKGRPTEKWVLVSGMKKLAVYNAEKGGVVVEGPEFKAYSRAQAVGKRAGLKLRAVPFSTAFYRA